METHFANLSRGAAVSERQPCRSQTLYLELSFLSLPLFSAEEEEEDMPKQNKSPALITTAL